MKCSTSLHHPVHMHITSLLHNNDDTETRIQTSHVILSLYGVALIVLAKSDLLLFLRSIIFL